MTALLLAVVPTILLALVTAAILHAVQADRSRRRR